MTSFAACFGAAPDGTWSAPGRVNLIGEHTDYNDGLCLPIALPLRTSVHVRRREDDLLRLASAQSPERVEVRLGEVGPGTPAGWASYAAGVVWALAQSGRRVGGLDVLVDGGVPLGAGLSSSAALECAVGAAASDLFGLDLLADDARRAELAALCVRAENEVAQAPTGGMDQAASLRCQEGAALLLDCRDGSVAQVPFDAAAAGLTLLVVDTRAEHALVDGQYAERRRTCERAAHELGVSALRDATPGDVDRLADPLVRRRAHHVVSEIERVRDLVHLLRDGRVGETGALMNASHASLRDDFEVSCAELDVACDAALAAGALGARMTGGGFGGSAIALVPTGSLAAVSATVQAAFAERGFATPRCFPVTASGPARRER